MKGQLSIQYLVAFVVFIGISTYIYFAYSQNVPSFLDEIRKETYKSEVFQISEMLMNDPGEPLEWSKSNVQRIGLSDDSKDKQNYISKNKMDILKEYDCLKVSDYEELKNKIGTYENVTIMIFDVNLNDGSRQSLFSCFPPHGFTTSIKSKVVRYATYDDAGTTKVAEIIIEL